MGREASRSLTLHRGTTFGEKMGSKDELQPLPLWGASGSREKAVSIVLLPQYTQPSSSQERANRGGFISSNLRDTIKERGEELAVGGKSSAKAIPPRGATQHRDEPRSKQHGGFQRHPKTAFPSHHHLM